MSECTARRQPEATANYKCLFFLDVGHDALRPSEYSNQSHMVSYCSAIKCFLDNFLTLFFILFCEGGGNRNDILFLRVLTYF